MEKAKQTLREKFYSRLFYIAGVKKLAVWLLNSSWFVNNKIYSFLQNRYIRRVIKKYVNAPNLVVIENTNLCNAHCLMCPHGTMQRAKGIIDNGLYQRIIDQCVGIGVDKIALHSFGEPLLDKDFADKVRYAKGRGIAYIGTSSNGSLMDERTAINVIKAGLDAINFSLDAYSQEAYKKIRVGLDYDSAMANVKRFIELRNKLNRRDLMVVVDFIETKYNRSEVKKFKRKWQGLADRVNITTLHNWAGLFKDKAGQSKFHKKLTKVKREPCRFLWTDMVINWDGRVSACCQDYEAKMIIGDARLSSLREIWRGQVLEQLRIKHLSGEIDQIPLCNVCDYRSVWWLFK